ncbi:MAG TPA: MoaD/ThiS family protein [Nitrososphaeraceae archaeon]
MARMEPDITTIRIKLFAVAKEMAGGNSQITVEFTEGTVITFAELRKRIMQLYPKLEQIPFVFATNYKIVTDDEELIKNKVNNNNNTNTDTKKTITPSDEIALLPPISGG